MFWLVFDVVIPSCLRTLALLAMLSATADG